MSASGHRFVVFLLALDCSTARGSAALGWRAMDEPPVLTWRESFAAGRGRGGELFTVLGKILEIIREDGDRLEGIVVGLGPGSYSGVRQSIAVATGLAMARGAWLRGLPSAVALEDETGVFQAVGDARRGAFYYTAVDRTLVCAAGPELVENADALAGRLAERPGWPVRVVESALPQGLLPDAIVRLPDAGRLFLVPDEVHREPPLEPIYLRPVSITLPKAVSSAAP